MKEYKEKVLEFLLHPENFEVVWELYDLFPDRVALTDMLLNKLDMKMIVGQVRELTVDRLKEEKWVIGKATDLSESEYGFRLYLRQWKKFFFVTFAKEHDRLYVALEKNIEQYNFLAKEKIENKMKEIESIKGFNSEPEWGFWQYIDYKDKKKITFQEISRLLPTNREAFLDECIGRLTSFAKGIKEDVMELVEVAKSMLNEKQKRKK